MPMITSVVRAFFHAGLLERGHAVRDRLDAGDRRAARRERVQHDVRAIAPVEEPVARCCPTASGPAWCSGSTGRLPSEHLARRPTPSSTTMLTMKK